MLELVVSILLLSTVGLVVIAVFPSAVVGTRSAGDRALAALVARGVIEDLRSRPVGQLQNQALNVVESDTNYRVQVEVSDVGDGSLAKQLKLTVTWLSRGRVSSDYVVATTVFRD